MKNLFAKNVRMEKRGMEAVAFNHKKSGGENLRFLFEVNRRLFFLHLFDFFGGFFDFAFANFGKFGVFSFLCPFVDFF